MVQVYKEPLCRRHYARVISTAFLFRVLGYVACIVLAYALAYSSGDMWQKLAIRTAQPNVRFAYDLMAFYAAEDPADSKMWTTSPALNSMLGSSLAVGTLQVVEHDFNNDGKPDRISIQTGAADVASVRGVNILMEFRYEIEAGIDLAMQGLAYVEHSAGIPGSELTVQGRLELRQQSTFAARADRRAYQQPILVNQTAPYQLGPASPFDFATILQQYSMRNETTVLADQAKIWKAGNGPFTATIDVLIPHEQAVMYRPRSVTELKFGFVQWLALFVLFATVFAVFESWLFRFRALDTYCTFDVQRSQTTYK